MNVENKNPSSLETRIGMYWLQRIGIVSLVFGVVFLITYSIQMLGNPFLESCLKLGTGLAVSVALLFLGRKFAKNENQKWYGHGLTAGGWSLAYFTTYAAHFIPDVRVISSLPVEICLLGLVAAGSLVSALRARSELMAIYSITLASVTILINGPGLFSDFSFLIIAITASVLGNRMSWRKLFAYAMASCYIGHFICGFTWSNWFAGNICTSAFLFAMWLTFGLGIGLSRATSKKESNYVTALASINALVLAAGLALTNTTASNTLHEVLFVAAGVLYLGTSKWLEMRKEEQLQTVHSLLGLFLINAGKCMHFSGYGLMAVDVLQIGLLATVGLQYQIKTFKWAAACLTVLLVPWWAMSAAMSTAASAFGFNAFDYVRIGVFAAAALSALAFTHLRDSQSKYFYLYHLAANLMWAGVFANLIEPSWRACAFTLLAVANIVAGEKRNSNYYSVVGLIPLIGAIGIATLDATENTVRGWLSLPMSLMTALVFIGYGSGVLMLKEKREEYVEAIHQLLAYVGTILMTILILGKAPEDFVSLGLGVEGVVFVVAGFLLKERFFRLSGLSVLAMLTGKLLFVDLAHHNTFERIFSFIAAGVVFLLASYAYGRFAPPIVSTDSDAEGDVGNVVPDAELIVTEPRSQQV